MDIRASDDEIDVVLNQMDTNGKYRLHKSNNLYIQLLKKKILLENGKIEFEEFANVMAKNYYKKRSREEIVEAFK